MGADLAELLAQLRSSGFVIRPVARRGEIIYLVFNVEFTASQLAALLEAYRETRKGNSPN